MVLPLTSRIEELAKQVQRQIRQKQYAQAVATLDKLEAAGANRNEVLWQKAVLESKIGHLHTALAYLQQLPSDEQPKIGRLEQIITKNWATYEFLIEEYNRAVKEIQQGRAEDALYILNDALHRVGDAVIPLEVYRMKTLLLARFRPDLLVRFHVELPLYALQDDVIKKVLNEAKAQQKTSAAAESAAEMETIEEETEPRQKTGFFKAAIAIVAVLAIGLPAYLIVNDKAPSELEGVQEQPPAAGNEPQAQLPSDGGEGNTETPSDGLAPEEQGAGEDPAAENDSEETTGLADDEKPMFLTVEQAEEYYVSGFAAYQKEKYNTAIDDLEKAIRSRDSEFFSDDAAYYLTDSYLKEGQYEKAVELAERFRNETSEHFTESPYRQAIRLQESSALIKVGRRDEGMAILEELAAAEEDSWVKHDAVARLKWFAENE